MIGNLDSGASWPCQQPQGSCATPRTPLSRCGALTWLSCFMQVYVESILALQKASKAPKPLQLAIMTSGDTHERTEQLLQDNQHFGMAAAQITLLKQEKVVPPLFCSLVLADARTGCQVLLGLRSTSMWHVNRAVMVSLWQRCACWQAAANRCPPLRHSKSHLASSCSLGCGVYGCGSTLLQRCKCIPGMAHGHAAPAPVTLQPRCTGLCLAGALLPADESHHAGPKVSECVRSCAHIQWFGAAAARGNLKPMLLSSPAKCAQVACLADGDARLALDPQDRWKLQTKPHGHGDVHALLHRQGCR